MPDSFNDPVTPSPNALEDLSRAHNIRQETIHLGTQIIEKRQK